MTAPVIRAEIAKFVAAVRAELDDLTPEEVEELTGGLEADLDDALSEAGPGTAGPGEGTGAAVTRADRLADPRAYAAELRAAAGLPPRGGTPWQGPGDRWLLILGQAIRASAAEFVAPLRAKPWWPGARDRAVSLQPAWWLLRVWVVFAVVHYNQRHTWRAVPTSPVGLLILLAMLAVSFELGRRGFGRLPAWRWVLAGLNLFAALALFPVLASLMATGGVDTYTFATTPPPDGIFASGQMVENVFPFDSQGRPLTGVQLFDQDGHPIVSITGGDSAVTSPSGRTVLSPAIDVQGRPLWNVFPLRQQGLDQSMAPIGTPTEPAAPLVAAPQVLLPTPSPSATLGQSPAPSQNPAPSQSPAPSQPLAPSQNPAPSHSPAPSPTGTPAR